MSADVRDSFTERACFKSIERWPEWCTLDGANDSSMGYLMRSSKAFTLIELMIVVAIIGLLAAIAIPTFLRFQQRAKRSEVTSNLKALFVAEQTFYAAKDTYSNSMEKVGFLPERGNRFAYKLTGACSKVAKRGTATETLEPDFRCVEVDTFKYDTSTGTVALPDCQFNAVVTPGSTGSFLACAAGNIDSDNDEYDQWSIASVSRVAGQASNLSTCTDGDSSAGQPCLDNSDI
jgi:type IV pilus assembly protein PilA